MSGTGSCYHNAVVETFFKTLKAELIWCTVFQTRAEAAEAIARYIDGSTTLSGAIRRSTSLVRLNSEAVRIVAKRFPLNRCRPNPARSHIASQPADKVTAAFELLRSVLLVS